MNKSYLALILLFVSSAGHADPKPLDLNVDASGYYSVESNSSWYQDEAYRSSDEQRSQHCQDLMNEIKALKNRPQKKFAAQHAKAGFLAVDGAALDGAG